MAAPQQEPSLSVGLLGASGSLLTKVNGSTMPFLHPVINDPWLRAKPFFGLYLLFSFFTGKRNLVVKKFKMGITFNFKAESFLGHFESVFRFAGASHNIANSLQDFIHSHCKFFK